MPPENAHGCVAFMTEDGTREEEIQAAIDKYVSENGYMPPMPILHVVFDAPPPSGFAGI